MYIYNQIIHLTIYLAFLVKLIIKMKLNTKDEHRKKKIQQKTKNKKHL